MRRKVDQPCDDSQGITCDGAAGLLCDPSSYRCKGPTAQLYESCGPNRRCAPGLSCAAGYQRCLPNPRREGDYCGEGADERCDATTPAGLPLSCDLLATRTCVTPQLHANVATTAGAHCYPGRPCEWGGRRQGVCALCAPEPLAQRCSLWSTATRRPLRAGTAGLRCSTSDLKCYNWPRIADEPCNSTNPDEVCGPGLVCRTDTRRCAPLGAYGTACYMGVGGDWPCAAGLACANGLRECHNSPLTKDEPCDPAADAASPESCPTGAGLACNPLYPYCEPAARRRARQLL